MKWIAAAVGMQAVGILLTLGGCADTASDADGGESVSVCGANGCETGETCANCPEDCGACGPICGANGCEEGETCEDCPEDCGACGPICGANGCEEGETCEDCPGDCGKCAPEHGFPDCADNPTQPLPEFDFGSLGYGKGSAIPYGQRTATTEFGPGTHTITNIINLSSNDVLRGAGPDNTTLYFPGGLKDMGSPCPSPGVDCYDWGGGTGLPVGVIVANGSEIGIEDVTIEFPDHTWEHYAGDDNGGYNGIHFNECNNCWARNVVIIGADNGIHVTRSEDVTIEKLTVETTAGGGHLHACNTLSHSVIVHDFAMFGESSHGIGGNWGSGEWAFANGWAESLRLEADHNGPATTNALYSNIAGTISSIQTHNRDGDPIDMILWNVEILDRCPLDVYTAQSPLY